MSSTSCTTTGLRVGDNETGRTPIGRPVGDDVLSLGVKATAPSAGSVNSDSINSGLAVGSQLPNIGAEVKQVGHHGIEGSNQGDHRHGQVVVDMDQFKNPPAPREFMRQTPISGHSPASPAKPVVTEAPETAGD